VTNSSLTVEGPDGAARLQYCAWVENQEDQNTLVLVHGNNLYWRPEAERGPGADIALSTDGLADTVFNGIPDWVYEEEVLGTNYAHYINEPGTRIAFAKFNDSLVPDFRYPHYGDPEAVEDWQYPEYRTVRYPKAGKTNPTVSLLVRTLGEAASKPVEPPEQVAAWGEHLYTVADWTDDDLLSVTWMNRIQNASALSECREEASAWVCKALHTREQPGGWIEIAPPPVYGEGGLLVLLPSRQPSGLTFPHVALLAGGAEPVFLTTGEFVVTEILAWDEDRAIVYLLGTDPQGPGARHLYTVGTDGGGQLCVSCSLVTSRGASCQRSAVLLNWDLSHYIHSCLGQGLPEAVLRRTSDHAIVFELETNGQLEQRLEGKALPGRVDTWVEVGGGHRAPVKLLLPPHMEEGAKYPLLVYVYGGPGSQMVTDSWSVGWGDYLVTSRWPAGGEQPPLQEHRVREH
jgi:dipeptidyl-peptidase-4